MAAPPQGDLASIGFEKTGIANQTGARDVGVGDQQGFCQEQTPVMIGQFSSMERGAFYGSYLSDKIPEAAFYSQAVKTVAYLRVATAQQDVRSQRLAILEYARKHGFRIDDFIESAVCFAARLWVRPRSRRRKPAFGSRCRSSALIKALSEENGA